MDEDYAEYMAFVDALMATSNSLSRLGAGVVAALALDIADDSRTFARLFSIAHALVLREVAVLGQEGGYILINRRDARTQRIRYELSAAGRRLVEGANA